jgi:uncharacterized protein HemX
MSTALAIAALAILAGLGGLSFIRQRETASAEKQETAARSHGGDDQRNRSVARRAATRLASEHERQEAAEDAPAGSAGS